MGEQVAAGTLKKKAGENAFTDRTDRGGNAEAVNLKQQGSADMIAGLYQ